ALRPLDEEPTPFGADRRDGRFVGGGLARVGLDSLLAFDWRVSLGGVELSPEEFDRLVRRQSPLVKLRGRWIEVNTDAAAAAEQYLQRHAAGETTLGDAFRAAFATSRDGGRDAPAVALSGSSWVRDLLDQLPAMRAPDVAQPPEFQGTLRPYQL